MARQYVINGETLVRVKGRSSNSVWGTSAVELGLSEGPIVVRPGIKHIDVKTDRYGSRMPAETVWNLADVIVKMTLVHYDDRVLDACVGESVPFGNVGLKEISPGTTLGRNKERWDSLNRYITVYLSSPVYGVPWRFRTAYLTEQPFIYPLGTKRSLVQLTWRAIPYRYHTVTTTASNAGQNVVTTVGEIKSIGAILWDYKDHTQDTDAST